MRKENELLIEIKLNPIVRFLLYPIGAAMRALRRLGAQAVFMTGSGSTVVGAFDDPDAARHAAEHLPGAVLTRTLAGNQSNSF